MTAMANEPSSTVAANTPLHDEQNTRDTRELPIDKVGVRGLRFPIQVRDRAHAVQNTIATIGMFVCSTAGQVPLRHIQVNVVKLFAKR